MAKNGVLRNLVLDPVQLYFSGKAEWKRKCSQQAAYVHLTQTMPWWLLKSGDLELGVGCPYQLWT